MAEFNLPAGVHQSDYDPPTWSPYFTREPDQEMPPQCEVWGCLEDKHPESDNCAAHTIEFLADEIRDCPLSEPVRMDALLAEMEIWRKK